MSLWPVARLASGLQRILHSWSKISVRARTTLDETAWLAVYYVKLRNLRENPLLSVAQARQRLLQSVGNPQAVETVKVANALGRVLARELNAPISLPPFENSAMDGYAVSSRDPVFAESPPYRLGIQGTSAAGHPWRGRLEAGAVRIFTGAAMPAGADTVILQEDARREGDHVEFIHKPEPHRHVRAIGNDVKKGVQLLTPGTRLRAFEIGWISSCGLERIEVFQRPRLGIFATGDELREPGTKLAYGQIFESNRLMLMNLASQLPVTTHDLGILPDDRALICDALAKAADAHDLLITSGGISVGESDHVRAVVKELGEIDFWRVAIKPGKPFASGRIGKSLFMGLPGNPASAVITFLLFVAPAILRRAGGQPEPPLEVGARLATPVKPPRGRMEYQRGRYTQDDTELWVEPTGSQDSNRIGSFHNANCLIRLTAGERRLKRGAKVRILPFYGILSGS